MIRTLTRAGAITAVLLLLAFGSGVAHAEQPAQRTTLLVGIGGLHTFVAGGPAKPVAVTVSDTGAAVATGVRLRVDGAGLNNALAVLVPPAGCTVVTDRSYTCPVPDLRPGDPFTTVHIGVRGLVPGDAGSVSVSVTADNADPSTDHMAVRVVAHGVDLVGTVDSAVKMAAGRTSTLPFRVTNYGDQTAVGLRLAIMLPGGLTFVNRRSTCQYYDNIPSAVCIVPGVTVAPGAVYRPGPGSVTVMRLDGAVPGPSFVGLGYFDATALRQTPPAPGGVTEVDNTDNDTRFEVWNIATNLSDPAALAPRVVAGVGQTVPLSVGFRNVGTAWTPGSASGVSTETTVTAPTGTTIVSAPPLWCTTLTAGRVYRCSYIGNPVIPGAASEWIFRLRIDSPDLGDDGRVSISTTYPEITRANDTVPLIVVLAGPQLPATGARVGPEAAAGVALLAVGLLLVIAARRWPALRRR